MAVVVVVVAESPNVESAWVTGQSSRRRSMWGGPCSVLALGSHTLGNYLKYLIDCFTPRRSVIISGATR